MLHLIIACLAITNFSTSLLKDYKTKWQKNFSARLGAGYLLQNLLAHQKITDFAIKSLKNQPAILRRIIEATHGKATHL